MAEAGTPGTATVVPIRTRWNTVVTVFLFGLFGNMSGLTIGVIAPKLVEQLHVTPAQLGIISGITGFLGIGVAFLAGWAADRLGGTVAGAIALALGAVTNLTLPLSSGFAGVLINRIAFSLGAGTAPTTPIGNRALSRALEKGQRAMGAALFNFTFPVGLLLLTLVGTLVIEAVGWQGWMYVLGAFGLLVMILWIGATGRTEREHRRVDNASVRWGEIFGSRTLFGTGLAWGLSAWSFLFLVQWLPLYFIDARHLRFLAAGLNSVWPWVGGVIGGFAVGIISDGLLRRTRNYRVARTFVAAAGELVFAVFLAIAALADSLTLVTVSLFIAELFNEMAASLFQVVAIDTLAERSGSASGFIFIITNIFAALSPLVTGTLFQAHLYTTAFLLAAVTPLLGCIVLLWLVYPGELRPWRERGVDHAAS